MDINRFITKTFGRINVLWPNKIQLLTFRQTQWVFESFTVAKNHWVSILNVIHSNEVKKIWKKTNVRQTNSHARFFRIQLLSYLDGR